MKHIGHILLHLTGYVVTTACLGLFVIGTDTAPQIVELFFANDEFSAFANNDVLMFLCLTGMFWGLIFIAFNLFKGRKLQMKTLKRAHGTTMTETIIALPVLLLLVFGLVQMSLNYISAILLDYGTFQAARTAWVWMPEAEGNRAGVSAGLVQEMARIQAALAVTPSAPGDYAQNLFAGSGEFKQARAMLLAGQLPFLAPDMGSYAIPLVYVLQFEDAAGILETEKSVWRSLGSSSFRLRSVRNFSFAYASVQAAVIDDGSQVGARITYAHFQSMPFVGRVFGSVAGVSGRVGYYSTLERELTLAKQFPANPDHP